jgi:hypothetical protein
LREWLHYQKLRSDYGSRISETVGYPNIVTIIYKYKGKSPHILPKHHASREMEEELALTRSAGLL